MPVSARRDLAGTLTLRASLLIGSPHEGALPLVRGYTQGVFLLLLLLVLAAVFGVGTVIEGILKVVLIVILLALAAGILAWRKLNARR